MSEKIDQFMKSTSILCISEEQRKSYEGIPTEIEILDVLKQIRNGAAPGSDGITVDFLTVFWSHLGKLIKASFNSAALKGHMSSYQCKAVITFIHKGKDLPRNELKNWRPISLTNSEYKLLGEISRITVKQGYL